MLLNKQCWENWISVCRIRKVESHPIKTLTQKWVKDLNKRNENLEILEKTVWKILKIQDRQ